MACMRVCLLPLDVIRVTGVVSLQLLVHVVQDHHGGDEVHRLPRGQQVQVRATVSPPVAISGHKSRAKRPVQQMTMTGRLP